jgi:hypothetical protein
MLAAVGDVYIQLHSADPGADGTSNIASMPTRVLADLSPAAGGFRGLVANVLWPLPWSGGAQTGTQLTAWDAPTGGTFMFSAALAAQVDFVDGMIPRLVSLSLAVASVASD